MASSPKPTGTASVSTAVPYPYSSTVGYWRPTGIGHRPTAGRPYRRPWGGQGGTCLKFKTLAMDMARIESLMEDMNGNRTVNQNIDTLERIERLFHEYLNIVTMISLI